jgi:uncharacterized protein (TIGR01777 family)
MSHPDPQGRWSPPQAPPLAGTARTVAVSGASGLIGAALVQQLERDGIVVKRLVRSRERPDARRVFWDPAKGEIDRDALEGVDAVVHLAGEGVAARWTAERKRSILRSRVDGTRLLAQTLAGLDRKPEVMVSASAVGIYGSRGDEALDEESAEGTDFLAEVGHGWEAAADPARKAGMRVVHTRFGIVLSAAGGALGQMLPAFRLGGGGRLGDGNQWMSWISMDDAVGAIRFAIDHPEVEGPVNVVGPEPLRNSDFAQALGRALGRPALVPVPAFALRLLFGEMADGAILASQRALPRRLAEAGYTFRHPTLDSALAAALRERG